MHSAILYAAVYYYSFLLYRPVDATLSKCLPCVLFVQYIIFLCRFLDSCLVAMFFYTDFLRFLPTQLHVPFFLFKLSIS